jgi:hypothetical protein
VRRPWNSVPTVFFYEYDFGDSWGHELRVEKMSKPNPRFSSPCCLAGARACPPEDCGDRPGTTRPSRRWRLRGSSAASADAAIAPVATTTMGTGS